MFRRLKKWIKSPQITKPHIRCIVRSADTQDLLHQFDTTSTNTVLQILREQQVDISSYCGGMCSCGTCMIKIVDGQSFTTAIQNREIAVLGFSKKDTHRLACQMRFQGTGTVTIQLENLYS